MRKWPEQRGIIFKRIRLQKLIQRAGISMHHVDVTPSRYPSLSVVEIGLLNRIKNEQIKDNECELIMEL